MVKHEYFLKLAKEASKKSDHEQHQIGTVIVKRNRVISSGYNSLKTHPRSPHQFKSTHSEFLAVLKADFNVKGAIVYVFRQQKSGLWSNSRPCKSCWQFLMDCGVKEVIYSFEGHFKRENLD
jgi:dCMP deaminase